jgi:hypothetical protein
LGNPDSGQPLAEALNCWAAVAATISTTTSGDPAIGPPTGFIAHVAAPGVILAAKPGDVTAGALVLRIYQPSNAPAQLTVELGDPTPVQISAISALEDVVASDSPVIQRTPNGFTIDVPGAITTIAATAVPGQGE